MSTGVLKLKHIGINQELIMPVVISSFEMDVSPKFSSTEVYGRMDPIFTYQNTVRKFVAILRTPGGDDQFTADQYNALVSGTETDKKLPDPDDPRRIFAEVLPRVFKALPGGEYYQATSAIVDIYMHKLADLYKMMYPVYDTLEGTSTGFMAGAPLLEFSLEGIAYSDNFNAGSSASQFGNGLLFAPDQFKVTSLMEEKEVQLAISNVNDLRFYASAKGYTITLGGTILHKDKRVGFEIGKGGNVIFGQGPNFPFNTQGVSQFDGPSPQPNTTRTTGASRNASGAAQNSTNNATNGVLSGKKP